jgi:hypothetical protein
MIHVGLEKLLLVLDRNHFRINSTTHKLQEQIILEDYNNNHSLDCYQDPGSPSKQSVACHVVLLTEVLGKPNSGTAAKEYSVDTMEK